MSNVSASSMVSLIQAESQHSAAISALRAQQEMELATIKMTENEERAATPGEGIGELVDRRA